MRSMDRWRVRSPRVADSWHALRWPAAVGAWLVVGSIALAGLVSAADPGSRHLRVTRELGGTVTVVNGDASAFCRASSRDEISALRAAIDARVRLESAK